MRSTQKMQTLRFWRFCQPFSSFSRLGARFLLFPKTAAWWLEHYGELRDHLEAHATELGGEGELEGDGACRVFELHQNALAARTSPRSRSRSSSGTRSRRS